MLFGGVQTQPKGEGKMIGEAATGSEAMQLSNPEALARIRAAKQVNAVTDVAGIRPTEGVPFRDNVANPTAPSFGEMLESLVESVDEKAKVSKSEANAIMSGESDNIHQAMIAMQEAGVAFTMLVEVRNKLTESYQQLLKMTVWPLAKRAAQHGNLYCAI